MKKVLSMAAIFIIVFSMFSMLCSAAGAESIGWQIENTIEIAPGTHYVIYYDASTHELKAIELPNVKLPFVAHLAIAKAPLWIREKLKKAFADLTKRDISVPSHSKPAIGDLNGDQLQDLVIGSADGALTYYENIGVAGLPQWKRNDKQFAGISVYNYSAPSLVDLNGDKKLDLAVGCGDGKVYFWWNTGTRKYPNWERDDTVFADIDVGEHSAPAFADLNGDGLLDLIVGSKTGLFSYRNAGSHKKPVWIRDDTLLEGVPMLPHSVPAFADLDGDGLTDLVVGSQVVRYDNWWGGRGDLVDRTLRRSVDLTGYTTATLKFKTRYEIEQYWDFGFVQVSLDGGSTWTSLSDVEGRTTYTHDPNAHPDIVANLPGFTGSSGGWVNETFDLSPFAGKTIMLQFRYMTDWGYTEEGWFIDDIQIIADGQTIFYDDVSTIDPGWIVNGWIATLPPVRKLYAFKNVGTVTKPVWEIQEMLSEVDVGKFSAPALGAIWEPPRIDLLIGCEDGYVYYVRNYGTPSIPEYPLWKSGAEETWMAIFREGPSYYPEVDRLVAVNEPDTTKYVETYANLILNTKASYVDEIAYCIANEQIVHLKILADKHAENLYEMNAKAIYDMAPKLKYVKIVEKKDYTTLAFRTEQGNWVEIPKEDYYQHLVMIAGDKPYTMPYQYEQNWYMTYLPWDTTYGVALYDRVKDAETVTEAMWDVALWLKVDIGVWWRLAGVFRPRGWYNIYKNLTNPDAIIACSEHAVMTMVAGRSVLIPTEMAVNSGEDHVWNEFFNEELRWVHIDTSATAPGDIEGLRNYFDNPRVYEVSWGKQVSAVWWGGWGRHDHITPRTKATGYTDISTVKFKVVDLNGKPIDGARVEAWSYWLLPSYGIPLFSILNYTDLNGEASLELGKNTYRFFIITRIGYKTLKATIEENQAYEFDVTINNVLPEPIGIVKEQLPEQKSRYHLNVEFKVQYGYQANPHWVHPCMMFGWQEYWKYRQGVYLDAYILDEQGYRNFASGLDFNAYTWITHASGGELTDIPIATNAYIVLSNDRSLTTTLKVNFKAWVTISKA